MPRWTRSRIMAVYAAMRDHSLPYEEWTHEAHIVTGLAFLDEFNLAAAEIIMPDAIASYNVSVGNQNTDTDGYHHTITLFYLRSLFYFMNSMPKNDLEYVVNMALNDRIADRDWPLLYYTKNVLFSVRARKNWVEPDKQALPTV